MISYYFINLRRKNWVLILAAFFFCSCSKWTVPPELVGQWKSKKHKITVRTKPAKWQYVFTSDSASVILKINEDKTASGSIGSATFDNAEIKKNGGNPKITGIAYIIKCGTIGKIYDNDPLDNKEVQLWLSPLEGGVIDSELRYTEGWAHFPMAGIILKKSENN